MEMLDLILQRRWMAMGELLVKLANMFAKPKLQIVFLINNYDMTISILKLMAIIKKEAGADGGKMQMHFEELLKSNIAIYVELKILHGSCDIELLVKDIITTCSNSH
ncbi:hypothetical protein HPP92_006043 [Vanilla planifolia]|uniref:Vps52 C-terminal domain-containing protein n=1 Tax=Vanilla planifolia TaxID=51239 RepID=A0A835RPI4_VANPL|nr:hypothetical protein HPP92_006372 [Vanilla planifolia]KAG0495049.1 hypothetical protein HPP92_006043 [Vanilla planifolia]